MAVIGPSSSTGGFFLRGLPTRSSCRVPGAALEPGEDVEDDGLKIDPNVAAGRRRPQPDDVAALAGGEVVPHAGLAALDLDIEAVAAIAVNVANEELVALEDAARQQI